MNTAGIRPGDIVECDVRGARFHAVVDCRAVDRGLAVRPLQRNITWREVTARQIVAHWRRSKQSRTDGPPRSRGASAPPAAGPPTMTAPQEPPTRGVTVSTEAKRPPSGVPCPTRRAERPDRPVPHQPAMLDTAAAPSRPAPKR